MAVEPFSYVNTSQERTKSIIHSVTLYLHKYGLNLDTIPRLLSLDRDMYKYVIITLHLYNAPRSDKLFVYVQI